MFSNQQIWQIKKYNGLLLVILLLIQAHLIVGDYYSDGTLRYEQFLTLLQKSHIKLFSTLFYGSLSLHLITAVSGVLSLRLQDRRKRVGAQRVLYGGSILFLFLITVVIWRV